MTHVFRSAFTALSFAVLSGTAFAQQSAPIRIGPGGSVYQTPQNAESQQLARQSARITDLEEEISRLRGRLEEVEFRLAERERAFEKAADQNEALSRQMADINKRLNDIEEKGRNTAQNRSFQPISPPANEPQARTAGPRSLVGGSDSGTESTSGNGSSNRVTTTLPSSSAAGNGRPQGTLGTLPASRLPGDAGELFELGKTRLLSFQYAGAEEAFRAFLEDFSEDEQAGEAHYWLGEVLYMQNDFKGSASFLTSFVREFPDSPRRADGVVKLARALTELGENDQACAFLGRLGQMDVELTDRTRDAANVQRQRAQCS